MEETNPIDELLGSDPQPSEIPYQNFGTKNGDEFPNCSQEVFDHGILVRVSPLDKESTENIVLDLRARGWAVDWHWDSSRLLVKALEPAARMEELRQAFGAACALRNAEVEAEIDRMSSRHEADLRRSLADKIRRESIAIDKGTFIV